MDADVLRIFAAAARRGTFTAAADDVGLSAVSVARKVTALEEELGIPLLVRGTRGVRPNEHGARLLQAIAPLERSLAEALRCASSLRDGVIERPVRISGTEPVIAEIVAPQVASFLRANPRVGLELNVATELADLAADAADIALRFARPTGDRLKVRKLRDYSLSLYRIEALPGDWNMVPYIGYDDTYGDIPEIAWARAAGLVPKIRTSSTRALLALTRGGVGTALLPDVVARRYGDLVRLDAAPAVPPRRLWLLVHPDVARIGSVRATIDWLVTTCR